MEENHMVTGIQYEESTEQPEIDDFEIHRADEAAKEIARENALPLDEAIKSLLVRITSDNRVPAYDTIKLLHRCLRFYDDKKMVIECLSEHVEKTTENIRSTTYQGNQA